MTEMVTSSSMSGEGKRSDGLLGESGNARRRSYLAPPALHATAPLLDSTVHRRATVHTLFDRSNTVKDREPVPSDAGLSELEIGWTWRSPEVTIVVPEAS